MPATESADSLVEYGEGGHGLFSEDGSFIGAYAGSKEKGSVESNGSSTAPFPGIDRARGNKPVAHANLPDLTVQGNKNFLIE